MDTTLAKDGILDNRIKTRIFPLSLVLRLLALGEALMLTGTGLLI